MYIYVYDPTNIYVFMYKIHTNRKDACIMRERLLTNVFSAQFI